MARKPVTVTETAQNYVSSPNKNSAEQTENPDPNAETTQTPQTTQIIQTAEFTETALVVDDDGDFVRAGNGVVLRVKNRVLVPSLELIPGREVIVKILEAFKVGKQAVETKPGRVKMEPGHFARVGSLSNDQRILWAPSVLYRTLMEEYEGDAYVGAWFQISHLGKKTAQDGVTVYNSFAINEVWPPTAEEMAQVASAKISAP